MATVRCMCEAEIEADLPDSVDLDAQPARLSELLSGSFFTVRCAKCGNLMRPEVPVRVRWASRKTDLFVLPEIERLTYYRGHSDVPSGAEVLIGFPELFERARILDAGLDPVAVEIVKYYLQEKAEESAPEAEIEVYFDSLEGGRLDFHVKGVKEGEIGVLKLPMDKYSQVAASSTETSRREPFAEVFEGQYRSFRKLAFLDEDA